MQRAGYCRLYGHAWTSSPTTGIQTPTPPLLCHAHACLCMLVRAYVRACMHMNACMHEYVCVHTCACMRVRASACACMQQGGRRVRMCVSMHVRACVRVCMHACVHACLRTAVEHTNVHRWAHGVEVVEECSIVGRRQMWRPAHQ